MSNEDQGLRRCGVLMTSGNLTTVDKYVKLQTKGKKEKNPDL